MTQQGNQLLKKGRLVMSNSINPIDELLDAHASLYAQTTMDYIINKITEEERDKEWHHSDLKTKHAIEQLLANKTAELETKVKAQQMFTHDSIRETKM